MDCNQDGLNGCTRGMGWMINDKWFCSNHWSVIRAKELATLRAENERLRAALVKADAWVNLQGDYPGCRPAADSMLRVIRAALEGGE